MFCWINTWRDKVENNAQERMKNQAAAVEFIQGFFFTPFTHSRFSWVQTVDYYNDALHVNESFFLIGFYHWIGKPIWISIS